MNSSDEQHHVALSAAYRQAARKAGNDAPPHDAARQTLHEIGYLDPDGRVTGAPDLIDWRIRLLSVLERCRQYFDFSDPNGGAYLVGALLAPRDFGLTLKETAPISAGGRGATLRQALEGCICEAAERLSIYDYAPGGPDIVGHDLSDGAPRALPRTDLLKPLAGMAGANPVTSAGCGAGASFAQAVESGLLELVERDAVALWWRGGRRGGPADDLAPAMKAPFAATARNGVRRWRWFLDLTTDLGVPVIGAVSALADGKGVVFAAAAAWDRGSAAAKAALELAQMELAADITLAKQAANEATGAAMSTGDNLWLDRLATHDARAHPLFHPDETRRTVDRNCGDQATLIAVLRDAGTGPTAFDLTLPSIGVPCARVVAPPLQQMAANAPVTPRLAAAIDEAGATPPPAHWPPPI